MPKPDLPLLNPPVIPSSDVAEGDAPVRLDDRPVMALGILGFGLSIPWLTGLWGPVRPGQALEQRP